MSGMTVYYRLSEENVNDIRYQRHVVVEGLTPGTPKEFHIRNIFHGAPVEIGMVCPAEVFKPYSIYEYAEENNLMKASDYNESEAKKTFSGYADLRVHLPGNDTLWVPRAKMDWNPSVAGIFFGVGTTVVPEIGKFTVVQPAPLLY